MKDLLELLKSAEISAAETKVFLAQASRMMPRPEESERLQKLCEQNQEMNEVILEQRVKILRLLISAAYNIPDKEYLHSRDIHAGLCDYKITSPGTICVYTSPDLESRMRHLTGTYNCRNFTIKASKECLFWQNFCLAMIRRIEDTLKHGPGRLKKLLEENLRAASVVNEIIEQHC